MRGGLGGGYGKLNMKGFMDLGWYLGLMFGFGFCMANIFQDCIYISGQNDTISTFTSLIHTHAVTTTTTRAKICELRHFTETLRSYCSIMAITTKSRIGISDLK
jgi:hypothetical protein